MGGVKRVKCLAPGERVVRVGCWMCVDLAVGRHAHRVGLSQQRVLLSYVTVPGTYLVIALCRFSSVAMESATGGLRGNKPNSMWGGGRSICTVEDVVYGIEVGWCRWFMGGIIYLGRVFGRDDGMKARYIDLISVKDGDIDGITYGIYNPESS